MASQSSRRRSDSRISLEHAAQLLQDGATLTAPSEELLASAVQLRKLGIVDFQLREFVQCAHPEDRDFPPKNRHCRGRIYVGDANQVSRKDLRCPECERPVFPDHYKKKRFPEVRTHVLEDGVLAYVGGLLGVNSKSTARGVFHVDIVDPRTSVCVIDYAEAKYLARERAIQHPTCFIAVNPRDFEDRFLQEEWVRRATLVEIVCGTVDLNALVRQVAAEGPPTHILQASVPVCVITPSSVIVEPEQSAQPGRRFVVEVGPNVVRVEGLQVVAKQAGPRFILFRVLWQCFLDDLKAGLPPDQFHAKTLRYLIQELDAQTGKNVNDEMTVRRALNRLQSDIEKAVKKHLGLAINRNEVVQTLRWSGHADSNHGFRINPFTVIVRPFQPDLSKGN